MNDIVKTNSDLLIACWATVGVLLVMALVFLRSKRKQYALGVLPLTFPAFMYIFSGLLANAITPVFPNTSSAQIRIILDLIAALTACVVIGLVSTVVSKNKKTRAVFVLSCSLFVLIFSSILIMNSASQLITLLQ